MKSTLCFMELPKKYIPYNPDNLAILNTLYDGTAG